jgi:hypothetical protein
VCGPHRVSTQFGGQQDRGTDLILFYSILLNSLLDMFFLYCVMFCFVCVFLMHFLLLFFCVLNLFLFCSFLFFILYLLLLNV